MVKYAVKKPEKDQFPLMKTPYPFVSRMRLTQKTAK